MPVAVQQTTTDNRLAAVRHAVYDTLLGYLPWASYEQTEQFIANLKLIGDAGSADDRRILLDQTLLRFLRLRVTPDMGETRTGATQKEMEMWLAAKYGDRLAEVAGFYRREGGPWRLNLPIRCALYAYRSENGFLRGILCQPLDRLDSFFLLSSAAVGGAKAAPLTPRDRLYFSQFEETAA